MDVASADDLLRRCREAQESGCNLPTIWRSLLKPHALVTGLPSQEMRGGATVIVVQLWTGQRLVSSAGGFELM